MRYYPKIAGKHLYLSPMNPDDAKIYTKWLNDPAVAVNLGQYKTLVSLQSEQKILEQMVSEGHNYAIVLAGSDELIGNIGLFDIDHLSRRATLGLFIGDAERRGRGYGAEAIRLILGYGFGTLNLHNIMLHCNSDNEQGLACYKKAGFCEIGRRRASTFVNGQYLDVIYMDILSTDF